jgi:pyridoxamine 5'-phosphate oxidase
MPSDISSPVTFPPENTNPFAVFEMWFAEAKISEVNDPEAMALATCDEDSCPNVRMVLLKGHDSRGFVFYSHQDSIKGIELRAHAQAALLFHWKSLRRQIRVRGSVTAVSDEEADAYFASRKRESQLGAWASQQSQHLEQRHRLEENYTYYAHLFEGNHVPRPPYWIGYRVVPLSIEFWLDRPFRLHERILYTRTSEEDAWTCEYLYP